MRSWLPFFSRRGYTNPFGKVGQPMGTLRLHAETEQLVRAAAAQQGQPVMEFIRTMIEMGFHGRAEIERRQIIRLDAIERVIPKCNTKEPDKPE